MADSGVAGVRLELERVRDSERKVYDSTAKSLDELISALQQTIHTIKADDATVKSVGTAVLSAAKGISEQKAHLSKEFKHLFTSVTTFGAELDKSAPQNLERAVRPDIFATTTVNQVIADALLRDGRFALAQQLADEARTRGVGGSAALAVAGNPALHALHTATAAWTGASVDALRAAFEELHSVVASLRARNVQPAIAWTTQQRTALLGRRPPTAGVSAVKYGGTAMVDDDPSARTVTSSVSSPFDSSSGSGSSSASGSNGSDQTDRLEALHDLLFSLHRLRFLQLLTADSPCAVHHTPIVSAAASPLTLAHVRSLAVSPAAAADVASASSPTPSASTPAAAANGSGPAPMAVSKSDDAPASQAKPKPAAAAALGLARAAVTTPPPSNPPSKAVLSARISQYTLTAMTYAQQHFSAFTKTHLSEIQRLSGCVLFGWDLSRAALTYPELTTTALWDDAEHAFRTAAYRSLGVSARSPLHAALTAADVSLPKLIRHATLTAQASALLLGGKPPASAAVAGASAGAGMGLGVGAGMGMDLFQSAEVDLGREHQYHTAFICPVTKEQSTADNPPVLLRCGHVISTTAMHKMIRSNSNRINRSGRFKCPTCPREQLLTEVVTIHF